MLEARRASSSTWSCSAALRIDKVLEPVTKVPRRGSERTIPSAAIRCSSRLTVLVLDPNSVASFRHDGETLTGLPDTLENLPQ